MRFSSTASAGVVTDFKSEEKVEIIVKLTSFPELRERSELKRELGCRIERIFGSAETGYFLVLKGVPKSRVKRFEQLSFKRKIKLVEPAIKRKLCYIPNDPRFYQQWNLLDVKADKAWDIDDGSKSEPVIAIVDSGADLDHPEIAPRLWKNTDEIPANGVDDDRNGYIDDYFGFSFTGVNQTYYTSHVYVGTSYGFKAAQTILSKGETITSIGLGIAKRGNPYVPINVEIYEGTPATFVKLVSSAQISSSQIGIGFDEVKAYFSKALRLTKDKTYTIVVSAPGTDNSNYYLLLDANYRSSEEDNFIRGNEWLYSLASGWKEYRLSDICFKVYPQNNPYDDEGHGTAVASIAAAETNNLAYIAGAAPKAKLMILKVSEGGYISSPDMIEAIYYAAKNGANVINLSLAGGSYSIAEQEAINYASSKGLVVVAASGNDSLSTSVYPAAYENVLAVSSYSKSRNLSDFSNFGYYIDLSAPGEFVPTVAPLYSRVSSDNFLSFGTSMSAPHVSAAASLCFSLQPELIGRTVEKVLCASADDIGVPGIDVEFGYGALNMERTLSTISSPSVERVYGMDRIQTSIKISQRFFPASKIVVVTTAETFPDSLSAVPLASALSAPILLTKPDVLVQSLKDEIARLKAEKIYIIGGTGAVSLSVETGLKSIAGVNEVVRLSGKDRYETSAKVAEELKRIRGTSFESIYIATGENFPDALSISPLAACEKSPVLLVRKDSIPEPTYAWLRINPALKIYIAGGTGAVSASLENLLKNFAVSVERFAGTDRYDTNRMAQEVAVKKLSFSTKYFLCATGENFPDALSVGVVCGKFKYPLVLLKPTYYLSSSTVALLENFLLTESIAVVGGPGAVPKAAVSRVFEEVKF